MALPAPRRATITGQQVEFLKAKQKQIEDAALVEDIVQGFQLFDADGSGEIDQDELMAVLVELDPEVWNKETVAKLWNRVDVNHDGLLSYSEFFDWIVKPKRPEGFDKDHEYTEEELLEMPINLKDVKPAGSLREVLEDDELEACLKGTKYHCFGKLMDRGSQQWSDERPIQDYNTCPLKSPPTISCQKGCKGAGDSTPNQDNISITCFDNGYSLACCFDGHGGGGHYVSTRCVQTVPFFLLRSKHWPDNIEEALKEAFLKSHQELVNHALENDYDAEDSGTTAVAALWKDGVIWFAHCGDSRALLISRKQNCILAQTADHKPEIDCELKRIEAMGGEVRSKTYPDGWVNHRIFKQGERYPGLCMSRTLGDNQAKEIGVSAEPEVTKHEINMADDPFFILSSDGVWEFLPSDAVARRCVKELAKRGGADGAVAKLQALAKSKWREEEGDYCDDITTVLVLL